MKQTEYVYVEDGTIPSVIIRDGEAYGEARGRWWPVIGLLRNRDGSFVPVLDIPQMDERPRVEAAG